MVRTLEDITVELTDRVLTPAKLQAETLVREATEEARRIVAAAEVEAEKIRASAERSAEDIRRQMDLDLEKAARSLLLTVEERLEKAVVDPVIEETVKPLLSNQEFLETMIVEIINGYSRHGGKVHRIEVLLPASRAAELESWFQEKFRHRFSQTVEIHFTDKISFGFKIGIAGTGTHVNFSDGLIEVLSEFCSPRFRKYFFSGKES